MWRCALAWCLILYTPNIIDITNNIHYMPIIYPKIIQLSYIPLRVAMRVVPPRFSSSEVSTDELAPLRFPDLLPPPPPSNNLSYWKRKEKNTCQHVALIMINSKTKNKITTTYIWVTKRLSVSFRKLCISLQYLFHIRGRVLWIKLIRCNSKTWHT